MQRKSIIAPAVLTLGIVSLYCCLSSCFLQFRVSDRKALHEFAEIGVSIHFGSYDTLGRHIHYAEAGKPDGPMLILVHGSPGSWTAFKEYFKDSSLTNHLHLIAIDRPGFGASDFGIKEESLQKQAAVVHPLLQKNRSDRKAVLLGHSYGGPVIARFAMDFPHEISGLIFLAPSIDPALERKKWYQSALACFPLRYLVPRALRVCNEEILALKNELDKALPLWEKIEVPVLFMQGMKDELVDPDNLDFGRNKMNKVPYFEVIALPDENHFLPWTQPLKVREAILKMSRKLP